MIELDTTIREHTARYCEIVDRLQAAHRWTSAVFLRLSALPLTSLDPGEAVGLLDAEAERLKEAGSWWGPLSTSLRFVLAAILIRRGLQGRVAVNTLKETLDLFKANGLGRSGNSPFIAAFLLVLSSEGEVPPPGTVQRMARLMELWKKDHRWLTGSDDLPMAALHALREEPEEELAARVESIYRELHRQRFKRGEQLQLASQLLALRPWSGVDAAATLDHVMQAARRAGIRPGRGLYDEASLLALSGVDPEHAVRSVIAIRDLLGTARSSRKGKKKLFGAFSTGEQQMLSIATGLFLVAQTEVLRATGDASAAAALLAARAALEAQQAAVIVAATTATTAASSSGAH